MEIVELHNLISNEMKLPNVVVDADDLLKNPGKKIEIISTSYQREETICKNNWMYTFVAKMSLCCNGFILSRNKSS